MYVGACVRRIVIVWERSCIVYVMGRGRSEVEERKGDERRSKEEKEIQNTVDFGDGDMRGTRKSRMMNGRMGT